VKYPRRIFLQMAVGAAALPLVVRTAWSLDYPTRPVRVLVGFPADCVAKLPLRRLTNDDSVGCDGIGGSGS
jgi:hypothetical protein